MRYRNFAILIAGFLLFQQIAGAQNKFFPLWQKDPPNAADTVLIYQGGSGRMPWTPDQFAPYVSYTDPRDHKEKWLFDGFLFIEFRDSGHTFSAAEGNGKWLPADKTFWQHLLDKNFEPGHGVPALEECCAETEKRLGPPLRPRQVILTLPEPVENSTNWGELDGRALDFTKLSDRVTACDWQIDQALKRWQALDPKHLTLAGFYFVPESIIPANQKLLPLVAQHIHELGLKFFWIPFWHAKGGTNWQTFGFDITSQQPNYFFHTNLPPAHLQKAIDFGRANGMGMEMEFDDRMIKQTSLYAPRFEAYLQAFSDNGVKDSASISYYEGGGTILHLARSENALMNSYYDRIAQWVVDRQESADRQFQKSSGSR